LAGVIRTKLKLDLLSDKVDGKRVYRLGGTSNIGGAEVVRRISPR